MRKKKQKGLSLIEMVVAFALLGIIMAAIGSAVVFALNQTNQSRALLNDQENARAIFQSISREMRLVTSLNHVNIPAPGTDDRLELIIQGENVLYYVVDDGAGYFYLRRSGNSPIHFGSARVANFAARRQDADGNESANGQWLHLTITGVSGSTFEVTLAIMRIRD